MPPNRVPRRASPRSRCRARLWTAHHEGNNRYGKAWFKRPRRSLAGRVSRLRGHTLFRRAVLCRVASRQRLHPSVPLWNGSGPWPGVSSGTSATDVGYQNTWGVTRGQSGATGILVNYTGGSTGTAFTPQTPYSNQTLADTAQYAAAFLAQHERVYPGIGAHYAGCATLSTPHRDPNLTGSYSCRLTGHYTTFSGDERSLQGNIHFVGERCSTSHQSYMEGTAQEGLRAAREIVAG